MNSTRIKTDKSDILYDADYIGQIDDAFFDPEQWAEQHLLLDQAPGRGTTVFVQHGESVLALRHYHRGGLPAKLSRDRYLWTGLERSRPWREWHLLQKLTEMGLPVSRPVAARIIHEGPTYRGDIVTEVIPADTLADWLGRKRLSSSTLHEVGSCIRRFHDAGVYHADLNARNILLDDEGTVSVIDFDRGELRKPAPGWQQENMERLKRSLQKFRRQQKYFAFDDEDWKSLKRGYDSGAQ